MDVQQGANGHFKGEPIKSSSVKIWFYAVVSAIIILMGLFLLCAPGRPLSAWFCISLGGLLLAIFVRMLARPVILILDHDGFVVDGGSRAPKKTFWRDVEEFRVYEVSTFSQIITYNLAPHVQKKDALSKFSRGFGGERSLGNVWPISTKRLAEMLNTYRLRALSRPSE